MKEPRYHIFLILLKRKWWFKGVTKNIAPPPPPPVKTKSKPKPKTI